MAQTIRRLAPLLAAVLVSSCGAADTHPQPSAAEVKAFLAKMDREQAQAEAKAKQESRAKAEKLNREHLDRVPAQN